MFFNPPQNVKSLGFILKSMGDEIEELLGGPLKEIKDPDDEPEGKQEEKEEASSEILDGMIDEGKLEELKPPEEPDEQPSPLDEPESLKEQATQNAPEQVSIQLEPLRVLEAALFLANKPLSFKQLQDILQLPQDKLKGLLYELEAKIPKDSAVQLSMTEHSACLQLKQEYLQQVSHLSKEVELSRKAMRILALVAKKRELLQSSLKQFFKGEIYAYVTELKNAGYIESKKQGNTRLLTPSAKFYDNFQFKE